MDEYMNDLLKHTSNLFAINPFPIADIDSRMK